MIILTNDHNLCLSTYCVAGDRVSVKVFLCLFVCQFWTVVRVIVSLSKSSFVCFCQFWGFLDSFPRSTPRSQAGNLSRGLYAPLITYVCADDSLSAKVFVCLFLSILDDSAALSTYGGADDSLSVKVFVDLFCGPQAAHRADKTKPGTFSFWFTIKSNARCCNHICKKCKLSGSFWSRCFLNR